MDCDALAPRLVVGLGNPGPEYEWTRHNIGAHIVRAFGEKLNLPFCAEKGCEAFVAKGVMGSQPVVLAVPKTYMNESGRSVSRLLRWVGVGLKELVVVVDDIETQWGLSKLVFRGGTRGHNGLRSTQSLVGSMDFFQLRFGVGRPGSGAVSDYVLQRFRPEELSEIGSYIGLSFALLEDWLSQKV